MYLLSVLSERTDAPGFERATGTVVCAVPCWSRYWLYCCIWSIRKKLLLRVRLRMYFRNVRVELVQATEFSVAHLTIEGTIVAVFPGHDSRARIKTNFSLGLSVYITPFFLKTEKFIFSARAQGPARIGSSFAQLSGFKITFAVVILEHSYWFNYHLPRSFMLISPFCI